MSQSVSVEGLAIGLFTNDISEAVLLQLKHRYESVSVEGLACGLFTHNISKPSSSSPSKGMSQSVSVEGLACGLFTNNISEAVLLQLKHRYQSVSLHRGPRKRSLH
jgi:hypothetical protein